MGKRPGGAIYKKNINMSFEHMKIYSTSLIIRGIKIKTMLRLQCFPTKIVRK